MLSMLTSPVVKIYIANALNKAQQEWLSHEIINHPGRLLEFIMSKSGINAFQEYLDCYRRYAQPRPKLLMKQVVPMNTQINTQNEVKLTNQSNQILDVNIVNPSEFKSDNQIQ